MSAQNNSGAGRTIPALLIGTGAWYALDFTGPLFYGAEINVAAALTWGLLSLCGAAVLADGMVMIGGVFDWVAAIMPTGHHGTAGWVKSFREIKKDLIKKGPGPYWGAFKGRELIADFAACAAIIGTSGSGKSIGILMPSALSIKESKTVIDFKSDLSCVLARTLRERGEKVHILNLADLNTDILGESASYNPLCIINDNFWRPGGIQDVSDDVHEMTMQLFPEPPSTGAGNDNRYFRDGSRTDLSFAIQMNALLYGPEAHMGHVEQMLNDRQSLLMHARWACGRLAVAGDGDEQDEEDRE